MNNYLSSMKRTAVLASAVSLFTGSVYAQDQDDVIMVMDTGAAESNLYWETVGGLIMPNLQTLVGNDPETGDYDNSALAESWEHNEDFTSWTFKIKDDAEFNDGWGPVTAEDVVHSVKLHIGDDSRLSGIQLLRSAEVTAVDDKTVRFDLESPDPDFLFAHAGRAMLVIYSKAQLDEEGLEGIKEDPAGSGPFNFTGRDLSNTLTFDVVDDHWSGAEVDYDTLELRFVGEPSTRMSMLLSDEADIVTLPRELHADAVDGGGEVITSPHAAMQTAIVFSGLFMDPEGPASEMDLPWQDVRIREAMNRAINREAMNEILYQGLADPLVTFSMDPRYSGYVPELADRFEGDYGYDPERARELLAEANYPDAFEEPTIKVIATELPGNAEWGVMAELVQSFFREVGLQAEIRESDWPSVQNARLGFTADFIHPMRNAPVRPNAIGVLATYTEQLSPAYSIGSAELNEMGGMLEQASDVESREEIMGDMFTYIYDNYVHIPVATVSADVVVNPERISGWDFPGSASSGFSHFHLIKTSD